MIRRVTVTSHGMCSHIYSETAVSLPCEPWEQPWQPPVVTPDPAPMPMGRRIEAVRALRADGLTARQIATALDITEYEVSCVLYRKSRRRCGVCGRRLTEANTSGVCRKCARCAR